MAKHIVRMTETRQTINLGELGKFVSIVEILGIFYVATRFKKERKTNVSNLLIVSSRTTGFIRLEVSDWTDKDYDVYMNFIVQACAAPQTRSKKKTKTL